MAVRLARYTSGFTPRRRSLVPIMTRATDGRVRRSSDWSGDSVGRQNMARACSRLWAGLSMSADVQPGVAAQLAWVKELLPRSSALKERYSWMVEDRSVWEPT